MWCGGRAVSGLVLLLVFGHVICKQPHILYVVMDDQGYGDVGYTYDDSDMQTPLLDQLAGGGLILDRHYAAWMCTPTRASLMTGRYPISLGIQHDVFDSNTEECLPENLVLLPEVVRSNGYATHLVGKWHLGYARWTCMPCMRGFDTAYGYTSGSIGYMDHYCGSYFDFYECAYNEQDGLSWDILTEDKDIYSLYLYNKRVKQIVENHDPDQPLFLYLSMQSVHSSYYAPDKYYSCHDNPRCTMQAMLRAAEELLADTISYFKAAGLWDDTLVIYHADNGAPDTVFNSNGQLRGSKSHLWEGGVRTVSFLFSENEEILPRRGSTSCYVHVSDWYQTIISISGGWTNMVNPADDLDSIDQSDFLLYGADDETCPRNEIMLHIDPVKRVAGYYKGQYKLLIGPQDGSASCSTTKFYPLDVGCVDFDIKRLYNIYDDPNETTNIAEDFPDITADLTKDLINYMSEQVPMQCQMDEVTGSYPDSDVPYYIPWDFTHDFEHDFVHTTKV